MKRLLLSLLLFGVAALGSAQTWVSVIDDTFTRANTSAGGAGTTTGAGNNWTDTNGGVANINSDRLVMTADTVNAQQWKRDYLLRPSSENQLNERMVITIPSGQSFTHHEALGSVLRWQSAGTMYLFQWNMVDTTPQAQIYKSISGTITSLASVSSGYYNSLDTYTMDCQVYGSNPTTVKMIITNVTTSTVIANISGSDSTAALQVSGYYGLTVWQSSGAVNAATYNLSEATTYMDSTLTVPTPTTSATENAVTPSVTWSGGTSTFTVKWYRGTSPTFAPGAGNLVATHSSATSPDTYTDSSATVGTEYWYVAEVIDSASGDVTTVPTMGVRKNPSLRIVYIGDSNMQGAKTSSPGGATAPPAQAVAQLLAIDANRDIAFSNQGVSGSTTNEWKSGATDLTTAIAAMNGLSGTVTVFVVALGTNDSDASKRYSGATYKSNLESMITSLRSNFSGCWISLNIPIYVSANANNGTIYDTTSQNLILNSYVPAIQAIPADYDTHVFVGDLTAFDMTANNTATWWSGETVAGTGDPYFLHLGNTGAAAWGAMLNMGLFKSPGLVRSGGLATLGVGLTLMLPGR